VVSANFETLAYIGASWYVGKYLNESYPRDFNWHSVTYLLGLLMIGRSWYVVFRFLIRSQQNSSQDVQRDKDPPNS
jgi:hypothetical protein